MFMLHCNMNTQLPTALHLDLEDVLGNLQYARRTGDLGRLVHLIYWDVRKWARWARRDALAERAADLIREQPHPSRSSFLAIVDDVIKELERILAADAEGIDCVRRVGGIRPESKQLAIGRAGA
jgi:hypothetical protein